MSAKELDELLMRWVVHDELLAVSAYVSAYGLEDGLRVRLRDLRDLLEQVVPEEPA